MQVALIVSVADAENLSEVPAKYSQAKEPGAILPGRRRRVELVLEFDHACREVGRP